jgi:hypothetical protein
MSSTAAMRVKEAVMTVRNDALAAMSVVKAENDLAHRCSRSHPGDEMKRRPARIRARSWGRCAGDISPRQAPSIRRAKQPSRRCLIGVSIASPFISNPAANRMREAFGHDAQDPPTGSRATAGPRRPGAVTGNGKLCTGGDTRLIRRLIMPPMRRCE